METIPTSVCGRTELGERQRRPIPDRHGAWHPWAAARGCKAIALRGSPVDVALAEQAIAFARGHATSFGQLADVLPASREANLAVVWRLIARGALVVDLTIPITADTRVTAP